MATLTDTSAVDEVGNSEKSANYFVGCFIFTVIVASPSVTQVSTSFDHLRQISLLHINMPQNLLRCWGWRDHRARPHIGKMRN